MKNWNVQGGQAASESLATTMVATCYMNSMMFPVSGTKNVFALAIRADDTLGSLCPKGNTVNSRR
jgi:hypothetical protein